MARRFHEGQPVVQVEHGQWRDKVTDEPMKETESPQYNQIYHVLRYQSDGYIYLREFGTKDSWNESEFSPVASITELTEILEQQPAEA